LELFAPSNSGRSLTWLRSSDLMRQRNGKTPPSKDLAKGLATELDIDESFLNRLAGEVRRGLGSK
jgi:hypothetical protein